jgi:hypothetical protein
VSASWVEITRQSAVRHQIRAAALAETTRRLYRVTGGHRQHLFMLDLLQCECAYEYGLARQDMNLHRAALISESLLPVGEAPKPVRVVAA